MNTKTVFSSNPGNWVRQASGA
uniref:Uncharacterized protein n=1 Tax=Anguilla anguilla TaxID=7936 RepID=A0A0E9V6A5_ANGAN